MKTITALCIAAILMTASIASLFIQGVKIEMIIAIGIIFGSLTQAALSRTEKLTGFYHVASIFLNTIACGIIDNFLREDKVLISATCFFMSSALSAFILVVRKHGKEMELKKAKSESQAKEAGISALKKNQTLKQLLVVHKNPEKRAVPVGRSIIIGV